MFTQKTCRGTSRFGEYSQEGVCACYRRAAHFLRLERGTLSHALNCGGWLGIFAIFDHQVLQLVVEVAE